MFRPLIARVTAVAAIATCLLCPAAQAQERDLKFVLDFISLGRPAPWYVALGKGYFKVQGLNVTIMPSNGAAGAHPTYPPPRPRPAIRRAVTNAKPVCLFAGDYGLEIYANSIGVSEDFLAKNPEIAKKFVRAALKGWKDALADPEEAARIEIQYVKALDPQIVIEEIQILKRIAITPDVEKNGFGYISTDRMKNTVDFINNNIEVSGDKLTAEQIYRPGYLPDVAIKP